MTHRFVNATKCKKDTAAINFMIISVTKSDTDGGERPPADWGHPKDKCIILFVEHFRVQPHNPRSEAEVC